MEKNIETREPLITNDRLKLGLRVAEVEAIDALLSEGRMLAYSLSGTAEIQSSSTTLTEFAINGREPTKLNVKNDAGRTITKTSRGKKIRDDLVIEDENGKQLTRRVLETEMAAGGARSLSTMFVKSDQGELKYKIVQKCESERRELLDKRFITKYDGKPGWLRLGDWDEQTYCQGVVVDRDNRKIANVTSSTYNPSGNRQELTHYDFEKQGKHLGTIQSSLTFHEQGARVELEITRAKAPRPYEPYREMFRSLAEMPGLLYHSVKGDVHDHMAQLDRDRKFHRDK